MSTEESRLFEIEIKVSAANQESVSIHREYKCNDAMSTDTIARNLYESLPLSEKSRMKPVSDQG